MKNFELGSYAQEGEDILLKRLFEYKNITNGGFYVDIGAHHPQRFSNTYFFYKRNWKGINVDATPKSMAPFNEIRPNDINLEYAVSDKEEELTYYMFNEPALNSFDEELSQKRAKLSHYEIIDTKKISTVTLEYILDTYLPANTVIDFLTIDVEGYDHNVLISNNWEKYRPKLVLVEILSKDIDNMMHNPTYKFMKSLNYRYYSKTVGTHIFIDNTFYQERFK